MKVIQTKLPGVVIIEPRVHGDTRGYFLETFQAQRYAQAGIPTAFVQDNLSRSQQNVLRGLHYQVNAPQGKLCWVLQGTVFDVAADIRPDSPTYGQYVAVELSDENHRQIYIPPGYAHGFCVLSESALFYYKCTRLYDPTDEAGVVWNDPDLNIAWPISEPLVSARDQSHPRLSERR